MSLQLKEHPFFDTSLHTISAKEKERIVNKNNKCRKKTIIQRVSCCVWMPT